MEWINLVKYKDPVAYYSDDRGKNVSFAKREYFSTLFQCTECNRRNGPDFGRVFLRSNYTDITQTPISKFERLRRYWPEKRVEFFGVCVLYSVRDVILPST